MLNALQINKNYPLSTFPSSNRRNFEDSGKLLATSAFEFYKTTEVQLYHPTLIRWLSLLYVYKGDFVARFCQPSRKVFEKYNDIFSMIIDAKNGS